MTTTVKITKEDETTDHHYIVVGVLENSESEEYTEEHIIAGKGESVTLNLWGERCFVIQEFYR